MRFNERGANVRMIQTALMAKGFALPKFGADGHMGRETWSALSDVADHIRLDPLPPPRNGAVVYPEILEWLVLEENDEAAPPSVTPECSGIMCDSLEGFAFYDLSKERVYSRPKTRMNGRNPHRRSMKNIRGLTIHNMGARFGVAPFQLAKAGGDRALALAERGLNVAAHVCVFRADDAGSHGPLIVKSAEFDVHMNHGNGLNPFSLGIEIDGLYPGVKGGRTWNGKPATPESPEFEAAVKAALGWTYKRGRELGADLRWLWAHRQSSVSRRSDPGEWIWDFLIPWALSELDLKLQIDPNYTIGSGLAIPEVWYGGSKGVRY